MGIMLRVGVAIALAGATAGAANAPPAELGSLAFLTGCWSGPAGGEGTIQEYYSEPAENIMLGATLFLRGGRANGYEFTRIEKREDGIFLVPYPNGVPSEHPFVLTAVGPAEAVFEAPAHDYPKRIVYSTLPDGVRIARIDGGADDPEPVEWRMRRVRCGPPVPAQ